MSAYTALTPKGRLAVKESLQQRSTAERPLCVFQLSDLFSVGYHHYRQKQLRSIDRLALVMTGSRIYPKRAPFYCFLLTPVLCSPANMPAITIHFHLSTTPNGNVVLQRHAHPNMCSLIVSNLIFRTTEMHHCSV